MNTRLIFTILGLNWAPPAHASSRADAQERTPEITPDPDVERFGAEVGRAIRETYSLLAMAPPAPRRDDHRSDRW